MTGIWNEERIKDLEKRVSALERQLQGTDELDPSAIGRAIARGLRPAEPQASCDKPQGAHPHSTT